MVNVATKYGTLLTSIHPKGSGDISQAFNAHRGFLTSGLARRALGTTEIEITAGATPGATITLPTQAEFAAGDWFSLSHTVNGSVGYYFTGIARNATATLAAVQLSDITPADDYFAIETPAGATHGFWFAGGRIQCVALASMANSDYILFTLADGSTVAFWFDVDGLGTEPAGSIAADFSYEVAIDAATDAASVAAILEPLMETNCAGLTFAVGAAGLIAVVSDDPGSGAVVAEFVANAGFTVALSDTVPAGAAALDNQVAVDISTGTTATHMADAIEAAVDTAFTGLATSANVAADLTITITAAGAGGNDYVLTENMTHAGFTVVDFAGGITDLTAPPAAAVDATDYQLAINISTATTAEDVEALVIAAINNTDNLLIVAEQDTSIDLNLPTAASGGSGVVAMLTGIIDQRYVWTLAEAVVDATFAIVQASTLDFKVNGVTISGGPFVYTTDDPGSVVVAIAAINAAKTEHNYEAYEGTNSSHVGLSQRRGGAITGLPTVTVTGSAAVEGGGAITDFSGDTDTLTAITNGAAAGIPTGTWEVLADLSVLTDYPDALLTHGYFEGDVDIIIQRGRRRTAAGVAVAGKTFATADGEFDLPCIGLGQEDETEQLISLGVWTVAGDCVMLYHFLHV